MRNIFGVFLCTVLFSSCNMSGDLDVNEELTLKKRKSIFTSKLKNVKIPTGNYKAKLKASSEKKIKLRITLKEDKALSFPFKIKEGTKLPESNGEVVILSKDSGQDYDLKVSVKTDTNSDYSEGTRSCVSGYRTEHVCTWVPSRQECETTGGEEVCVTRRSGERVCADQPTRTRCHTVPGHQSCRDERIPIYGSQSVTYETTTTSKSVIVRFLKEENIVAKFDHIKTDSDESVISSGACY